jgi:regulation of enolase protein 1 (concanavalin A-like superfamily)
VHRVDGQPWLNAPLTYQDGTTQVSPFVTLTDHA